MKHTKVLAALTSLGVTASMVAFGGAAAATTQDYTPSLPNPQLEAQCGLDFGLVLDSSGSIGNTGIQNLKNATDAFVDALVDTGSTVAVTSFSTSSPGSGGANLTPTALTSANLAGIKASYSGLNSDGWTNWEDGLQKMKNYFPPAQSWQPKLMILITDGNPNTTNTSSPGQYTDGSPAAVNPAISLANDMKTAGVKMFGIAVGGSINLEPIKKISNSTAYDGTNFPTAGYVQTDDYAALAGQLKELAVDLCAPSLTITKLADTPTTEGFEPADGWTFDTTVTVPDDGDWVKPSTDPITKNVASTESADTANGGAVTFQWEPDSKVDTDPVIVKETLKDGYEQHPKLYCTVKNIIAGTDQDIEVTVDGDGEWDLGMVGPRDVVTCTAKNTLTKLNLVKVVETGSAQPSDFQLLATPVNAPGAPSYDHPGDYTSYEPIAGGVTYQLSETGPANYTGSWVCTNGVNPNGLDQIVVPKGTKTRCTITNTRDLAELKLVKQVDGADPDSWTLTAQAAAPENDRNISTPGGSGQFETVYAGTEYTLGETGPGGYSPSDWVCLRDDEEPLPQVDGQLNEGDKITLGKGQRVTCTIVNTRDLGSLTISKEFNPQTSGFAGTFDITYTCVEGATPVKNGSVQLAGGQSQTITGLPTGTVCTVSEPTLPAPPAGWQFNPPVFTPGDQATITTGGQNVTVTVTNSIAQVSPEVVRRACPINPDMNKPKPKRVGNRILLDTVKTRKSACFLVKPVVLCRPLGANSAGEAAFCETRSTRRGLVRVDTEGYDAVRVTVVVRAKPKAGFKDRWKAKTWRKSWILR